MNISQSEYREKIRNNLLCKQRKLLESYYLLKAKSFNSPQFEESVARFIHNGTVTNASRQGLCVLFSDVDPELYDLPDGTSRIHLYNIYKELFALPSERDMVYMQPSNPVPCINTVRSTAPKQNAPRTPHAASGVCIVLDSVEECSDQYVSEYSL